MTSDDQFDELMEVTDECHLASLVCDQSPDKVLVPVQSVIQPIFADTPAQGFVMVSNIIEPTYIQPDVYYDIFPLLAHY